MRFAIDKRNMLPHQREWWELDSFLKLLVGGYGCGKTYIGALRSIYQSYVNRPHPVLYVSPTYPQSRRTIVYTIEDVLTRSRIPYEFNKSQHEFYIPGWRGRIWIASGEIPNSLKGPNVAAAGIDEPFIQKLDTFNQVMARVREPNARLSEIFLTGTPEQLNWGYDVAMNDAGAYDLSMVVGRTAANTHLSPDYVERLMNAYDEDQCKAYLDGQFLNLTKGQVYRHFDRSVHVSRQEVGSDHAVMAGIDFNVDYMSAELFICPDGRNVHWFDEIRLSDSDTYALADRLHERFPGITVYPDASGSSRRSSAKSTDHAILKERGFRVRSYAKNPAVRDRVNAMNGKLRHREMSFGNVPFLIKDMERVVWKGHEIDKSSDPSLTHSSDAAGYPVEHLFPVRVSRPYEKPLTHFRV